MLCAPCVQDFGQHGREFITSEVGLKLLQALGDPEQLSQLVGGGKRAARLQAILQQCVFKVRPAAADALGIWVGIWLVGRKQRQFSGSLLQQLQHWARQLSRALQQPQPAGQSWSLLSAKLLMLLSWPPQDTTPRHHHNNKPHHTTPLLLLLLLLLQILPMENVAGRDLVEAGNLCERKNGRGVDPNRNWDIDWGVKEKDYDPKEEYPGKAAFRCAAAGVWA